MKQSGPPAVLLLLQPTKTIRFVRCITSMVLVTVVATVSTCRRLPSTGAWTILPTPQLRCRNYHHYRHYQIQRTSSRSHQKLVLHNRFNCGDSQSTSTVAAVTTSSALGIVSSDENIFCKKDSRSYTTESSYRRSSTRSTAYRIPSQLSTIRNCDSTGSSFHRHQSWFCSIKTSLSMNDANMEEDITRDDEQTLTTTVKRKNQAVPTTNCDDDKTLTSEWNIAGLKQEICRRLERAKKKVDQFTSRMERHQALSKPPVNSNTNLDFDILKAELVYTEENLKEIRHFETLFLTSLESNGRLSMVLPEPLAIHALALNMTDHPPKRPIRGEPKAKGPRTTGPTRKPYRKYISSDNIEIRVGKKAEDNDELSTNPLYRDNDDWWLHAAGCPGSHVIIRYSDRKTDPPATTIQDAATLAAKHSKGTTNIMKVNMCRARDIKKPPMSKPGLVMIVGGTVRTVKVDMKASEKVLQRLETTVEVN